MKIRKHLWWIIALDTIVVLGFMVWLFSSAFGVSRGAGGDAHPGDGPPVLRFGAFSLTGLDGGPVDASVLDGELTLVDFFFTGCPLYCPGMTAVMKHVADETEGSGLRLLSISIDADAPEAMREYAESFGVDFDRWVFATAERDTVWGVIRDQLTFDVSETTPERGSINHPTRLFLVGPDRAVVGMYRYDDDAEIEALVRQVYELSD